MDQHRRSSRATAVPKDVEQVRVTGVAVAEVFEPVDVAPPEPEREGDDPQPRRPVRLVVVSGAERVVQSIADRLRGVAVGR